MLNSLPHCYADRMQHFLFEFTHTILGIYQIFTVLTNKMQTS